MGDPTLGTCTSAGTKTKLVREMKFHLLDSASRKSSESFRKIKEAIVITSYSHDGKKNETREMKSHLHGSTIRNSSESFGKIKEAIVAGINLVEFDNPIEIWEGLKMGTKFLFEKPKLVINSSDDVDVKEMPDFESVIRNDPLTTLSRVESLMHMGGANENILDYLSRFRSGRDIIMQLFVSRLIDGFVEIFLIFVYYQL